MAPALRTQGVKELVEDVLRSFRQPYSEDVIGEVFQAIESRPEWLRRYTRLRDDLGEIEVNQWIGQWVARATGRTGAHPVQAKSALVGSYSKLYPPDPVQALAALYEADETAWLDTMAQLAAERRVDELDYEHLSEFLADMARRDRREVRSRLTVLLMHLLKWEHQPDQRSNSWRATIVEQRQELINDLAESGTLRNYGREVLPQAYQQAVKRAAAETGLDAGDFPGECPWSWEQAVEGELPAG